MLICWFGGQACLTFPLLEGGWLSKDLCFTSDTSFVFGNHIYMFLRNVYGLEVADIVLNICSAQKGRNCRWFFSVSCRRSDWCVTLCSLQTVSTAEPGTANSSAPATVVWPQRNWNDIFMCVGCQVWWCRARRFCLQPAVPVKPGRSGAAELHPCPGRTSWELGRSPGRCWLCWLLVLCCSVTALAAAETPFHSWVWLLKQPWSVPVVWLQLIPVGCCWGSLPCSPGSEGLWVNGNRWWLFKSSISHIAPEADSRNISWKLCLT